MTSSDSRILIEFLERWWSADEAERAAPLATWLARFPAHEASIARAWLQLRDPGDGESRPTRVDPVSDAPDHIGPFHLLEVIGRGGQGEVFLANDPELGRTVALKVFRRRPGDSRALARFRREAGIASRLDHPGICTVYDIGREEDVAWISMRYVPGTSLGRLLEEAPGPPQGAALDARLELVEKVARAIHHAHEAGIVHRDLKPGNVRVTPEGEPVVLDFGLAWDEGDAQRLTLSGEVFGTPAYMSPEQLDPTTTALDRRTDVYALGVILFQALTGRLPFTGPTFEALSRAIRTARPPAPRQLNPALSGDATAVLELALQREREGRYRDARELADDLERLRERRPVMARRAGPLVRLRRWVEREPLIAALGALVLLSLAGGLAVSLWLGREAERNLDAWRQAADLRTVEELLAREVDLHPVSPELVAPCEAWLAAAGGLIARRSLHREALARMARAGSAAPAEVPGAWLEELLGDLLERLDLLEARRADVRRRRDRSETIVRRTVEVPAAAWAACLEDLADGDAFADLELRPQVGLVPLGRSERTGLWEFWHVESGARPAPGDDGSWVVAEDTGIVFVLLPGGTFTMGCPASLADDPVLGGLVRKNEHPAHEVTLAPFLISKYETTQAQWMRAAGGANPAYYFPGTDHGARDGVALAFDLRHPVENVTWDEAARLARVLGLALPTEAQWEFASARRRDALWSFGPDPGEGGAYANTAGLECAPDLWRGRRPLVRDPHRRHAPVGSYLPNRWGLHDMAGNVAEWCRDPFVDDYRGVNHHPGDGLILADSEGPDRANRGGSFWWGLEIARITWRNASPRNRRNTDLGLRCARAWR